MRTFPAKRRGTFFSTPFKNFGIEYLRGILHTYGSLNQSDSNLSYDYDIIEIEKSSGDLTSILKAKIPLFANRPLSLEKISHETYHEYVAKWLFMEKLSSASNKKKLSEAEFISELIREITLFKDVYLLNDLSSDYETYPPFGARMKKGLKRANASCAI